MDDISEPLGKPKPVRFWKRDYRDMGFVADNNHQIPIAHVARVFARIGLKLTKANGGVLPTLEQVMVRRAKRDAARSRK